MIRRALPQSSTWNFSFAVGSKRKAIPRLGSRGGTRVGAECFCTRGVSGTRGEDVTSCGPSEASLEQALAVNAPLHRVVLDCEPAQDESLEPSGPPSGARFAAGRLAKKTSGPAPAAIRGIYLIQAVAAPPVSTVGLPRNAGRAPDGRRTRSGMRNNLDFLASKF